MVKINRTGKFDQSLDELSFEDPDLQAEANQRIHWFEKNPNDTRLENHPLTKRMTGKWAFSITNDIRIVYKWTNKTTARFLAIGPHIKVYPKSKAISKKINKM